MRYQVSPRFIASRIRTAGRIAVICAVLAVLVAGAAILAFGARIQDVCLTLLGVCLLFIVACYRGYRQRIRAGAQDAWLEIDASSITFGSPAGGKVTQLSDLTGFDLADEPWPVLRLFLKQGAVTIQGFEGVEAAREILEAAVVANTGQEVGTRRFGPDQDFLNDTQPIPKWMNYLYAGVAVIVAATGFHRFGSNFLPALPLVLIVGGLFIYYVMRQYSKAVMRTSNVWLEIAPSLLTLSTDKGRDSVNLSDLVDIEETNPQRPILHLTFTDAGKNMTLQGFENMREIARLLSVVIERNKADGAMK